MHTFDDSYLPMPFSGESLYSWCTRFHRINGNTSARLTCRLLFSDSTAGLRHDFPTHLNAFSKNTKHLFGSVDELIYQRTVFGIFSPFLKDSTIESIVKNMHEGGHTHIKHLLGILPSRVGNSAPLKACPSCMRSKSGAQDMLWWRIEHQWPTSRVCSNHGDYLLMPEQGFHARALKEWFLPRDIQWQMEKTPNEKTLTILHKLNEWGNYLATRSRNPFDSDLLRLTYHLRAKALGWTAMDGSLKFTRIKSIFREHYACLENLRGYEFIRETNQIHGGFLGSLLHQFEGSKHPLKHALIMSFLFDNPQHFNSEYQQNLSISDPANKKAPWAELTTDRRQLRHMVETLRYSVNAAATQLGLPVGQALRYLKTEGVKYVRRPRVLNQEKESNLRHLLCSGADYETIVATLGIRKSFIREYLARNPTLRVRWENAHNSIIIEKYRSRLTKLIQENPNSSTKKLQQIPGNGIQWLMRHDKSWLNLTLSNYRKKLPTVDNQ